MGKAKRRKKLDPNYRKTLTESITLVKLPLTFESLESHDLIITKCDFKGIDPELIECNSEILLDEVMGFCPQYQAYGRRYYLNPMLRSKEIIEQAKNCIEKQPGVLFIYHDYEQSDLSTFFFVETAECEHQLKFALGNHVGSWIANLVRETAQQSSIRCFPILTYAPIPKINDENPASFFIANLA
ncbi:hypothetical protein H6G41_29740 [Tolypothrix sp. FACHB-123]|uniref:hypothetical protein n=1 Tax=Tolypothrix sp. FACHB-123 TaxID=2692868 RepID=UPI001683C2FA|nr:hypothetical protein [Tolypothrix sp. FACHB-123]MBD2358729.1 hypothetical protein [Tolypothrix sp. FACHB-123]